MISFLTRSAVAADLAALGLRAGDMVMVHAGMRAVGPLLNGPDALIDALRDVVGPDGTIMAYAYWDTQHEGLLDQHGRVLAAWRDHVPPFDAAGSRAARNHGAFVECLRTTTGAFRSANPSASMVAIGAKADWLTRDHAQDYGYGPGSPLARLVSAGGRVLIVGAPHSKLTLLHLAEHLADIPGKHVVRYEVPFATPTGTEWRMIEEFETDEPVTDTLSVDGFERIVDAFLAQGHGATGKIGNAPATLVDAAPMLAFGIAWIEAQHG
ncbi:MAG: aminoglycoside 3-N-acetyltransferase [Sphingomonadaceae bacterium]